MERKQSKHLQRAEGRRLTPVGALKLFPALIASGYVLALALGGGAFSWVGLLAVLPLLRAIQILQPKGALVCGFIWGASLYGFGVIQASQVVSPGLSSLCLLSLIPGLYALGGAWATRRWGFSPFVLGAGWMLVEFALRPLSLRAGLLTPPQEHLLVGTLCRMFGYILLTFFVAYASAWLLAILTRVNLRMNRPVALVELGESGRWLWHVIPSRVPCVVVSPSRPRAPPASA